MKLHKEKLILLHSIPRPKENKKFIRVGRGNASHGNKSGRGDNGQKSRPGSRKVKTEGGQFPTHLRFRKIGFYRQKNKPVLCKTSDLNKIYTRTKNENISLDDIKTHLNLCPSNKRNGSLIKLLYDEQPVTKLNVCAHAASKRVLQYVSLVKC